MGKTRDGERKEVVDCKEILFDFIIIKWNHDS